MWNGKKKAVTFSFDDGVLQDARAIEILDKYNLKCTFNLNSALLGCKNKFYSNEKLVSHDKVSVADVAELYANHEVAVHTLSHPKLTELDEKTVIYQVEEDRKQLESLTGKKVVGMAYPCGGENNNDRVAEIIKNNTGIKFARTITSTYNFDLQTNLLRFNPTVYYVEPCLFDLVDRFLKLETDKPQLLYIWGHTYEMDGGWISWERFEELCKTLSDKSDIFYGTNSEVLL